MKSGNIPIINSTHFHSAGSNSHVGNLATVNYYTYCSISCRRVRIVFVRMCIF